MSIYVNGLDQAPGNHQWRIEKYRKSDLALIWAQNSNPSGNADWSNSITSDATNIYITGIDWSESRYQWRIEKRNKATGQLEGDPMLSNISGQGDEPYAITTDGSHLYVVGFDSLVSNWQWRIESWSIAGVFVDIGLRVHNIALAQPIRIAAEPLAGLSSPLRMIRDGDVYGIALVDPGDPMDSGVRIQTSSGVKALRKL